MFDIIIDNREIYVNFKKIKNEEIYIFTTGNIYYKNKKINMSDLKRLYKIFKEKIYSVIDGIYNLIIIDNVIGKMFIFQDFLGSNEYFYYYKKNNRIYISNMMKNIILHENGFTMNSTKILKKFLKYGYIDGKETIIKKINKTFPLKYIKINLENNSIELKKYNKINANIHRVSQEEYNKVFENICRSIIKNKKNVNMTISSGYDSNYILFTVKNIYKNIKINSFCIGGKKGRNEIPNSNSICSFYKNVKFEYKYVDYKTFDDFPKIVLALEGSMYESGIFLQYELSRLLEKEEVKDLIVGECADQVLNYYFNYRINNKILNLISTMINSINIGLFKKINKPRKSPFEDASYKIIKKNGIILRSKNVKIEYPYLRKDFIDIAKSTSRINGISKKFHKEVIGELVNKNVSNKLKKIGGATDLKELFQNDKKIEKIKEYVNHNKYNFYKNVKFDDQFYELDYYLKVLYLNIFEKIFINNNDYLKEDCDLNLSNFIDLDKGD